MTVRLAIALALLAVLGAAPGSARAQEFSQAVEAFDRGDHESAWFMFWELAQKGDSLSQFNLGQMYRLGLGVPTDLVQSRRWYEAAAQQGHPRAQFSLGVFYEFGHGVSRDTARARTWYQRAAAQNLDQAREALARLDAVPGSGRAGANGRPGPTAPATANPPAR